MELTQSLLKEILHYHPETGQLVWSVNQGSRGKAGNRAGSCSGRGYRQIRLFGKNYPEHRVIWFYTHNSWPTQIDHINGIRDDNRIENLREAAQSINSKNCRLSVSNSSGKTGVWWSALRGKWVAQIKVDYKLIFLGRFYDYQDAASARDEAEKKYGFHENHGKRYEQANKGV